MFVFMEACSARREGELMAHDSSRAERALVVVVVVDAASGGASVVVVDAMVDGIVGEFVLSLCVVCCVRLRLCGWPADATWNDLCFPI